MKFILSDMVKDKLPIKVMRVHAYGMNTYLVSLTIGEQQGMPCENGGGLKPLVTPGKSELFLRAAK